jgi:hypothetical protein
MIELDAPPALPQAEHAAANTIAASTTKNDLISEG